MASRPAACLVCWPAACVAKGPLRAWCSVRGERARFLIAMNASEDADFDAVARFERLADDLRDEDALLLARVDFSHQS